MVDKEVFSAEFAKRLADATAKTPATVSIPGVGWADVVADTDGWPHFAKPLWFPVGTTLR
jgi:hypothetical protein